ncbi:MAG TPA: peptidoglycan recognition family protein [Gemmatimonadales bacterium]|nr:peptidoglycan recognition family protein [Gemmatimonadales bacterium]
MADDLVIPFVKARWFTNTGSKGRKIDLIVIHDMEAPETDDMAERIARMFATTTTQASTHYCVDNNSIVQDVLDKDVAWHAPGANSNGLGIEHAGYANQRADQWADAYSAAELQISARLSRKLCDAYQIPINFVPAADLLAGKRGITTHAEVSKAWKKSTHWDPGPNFPMGQYIDMVRSVGAPAPQEVRLVVNAPVVGMMSHPSWNGGYAEIGADGGVFSFKAPNYGALGGIQLNAPVVGGDVTPDGGGYWLCAADGGVFAFGNARGDLGSMGGKTLNKPVVGMKTFSANGYWLIAQDGGLFNFGDAPFLETVTWQG